MTTYAACLTPAGTGAIAVLAIRGPRAWDVVRELFHPFTPPQARSASKGDCQPLLALRARDSGCFYLGRFGDDATDEAVLAVKRMEPVPWLELHCHGGVEVVRMCLDALQKRGVEVCSWQRLQQHTEDSPLRVAATAALTEARTVRTAAILLDQVNGAFENALNDILTALDSGNSEEAQRHLQELSCHAAVGRHLTQPWRVVIAGAPNVGKSSLVNALAGYQRSIIAPTPGTTRDVVSVSLAVDGWPVELLDTAGLRDNAESLEAQGIHLARTAIAATDLCLWVLDGSTEPLWPEERLPTMRFIVNKVDLPAAWDHAQADVAVSAQTGVGVAELLQALSGWLVPEAPSSGTAVPFTPGLAELVTAAANALDAGRSELTHEFLLEGLTAVSLQPGDVPAAAEWQERSPSP